MQTRGCAWRSILSPRTFHADTCLQHTLGLQGALAPRLGMQKSPAHPAQNTLHKGRRLLSAALLKVHKHPLIHLWNPVGSLHGNFHSSRSPCPIVSHALMVNPYTTVTLFCSISSPLPFTFHTFCKHSADLIICFKTNPKLKPAWSGDTLLVTQGADKSVCRLRSGPPMEYNSLGSDSGRICALEPVLGPVLWPCGFPWMLV